MIFLSRMAEPRFVVEPKNNTYVNVGGKMQAIYEKGKSLKFKALSTPMQTAALPAKYGKQEALGILDTSLKRQTPGMTEEEAIEALFAHDSYGVEFIAIGKDGTAMVSGDQFIQPTGRGSYCELCDQQIKPRGLHVHVNSAKHKSALIKKEEELEGIISGEAGA